MSVMYIYMSKLKKVGVDKEFSPKSDVKRI